jgi:ferredoxin-NADP reductase
MMMPQALKWQVATVERVWSETAHVKSYRLALPDFAHFRPGQHVDVRLTAPNGYQAQRSYSIASAPQGDGKIEITVELIEDGEVSPYFHEVIQEGDQIEIRGPIGGPFTWTVARGGPLLLVGGGSGVVPLMSMLRHRAEKPEILLSSALLYSSRGLDDVIYRDELEKMAEVDQDLDLRLTLTREKPPGWSGNTRRVDARMLREVMERIGRPSLSYICGPTGFVESIAEILVNEGLPPDTIITERFGPSGS